MSTCWGLNRNPSIRRRGRDNSINRIDRLKGMIGIEIIICKFVFIVLSIRLLEYRPPSFSPTNF